VGWGPGWRDEESIGVGDGRDDGERMVAGGPDHADEGHPGVSGDHGVCGGSSGCSELGMARAI